MLKYLLLVMTTMSFAAPVRAIVINEFQTSSPQTVELYNNGAFSVDLSGWFLDDSGGTTYVTIPDNSVIGPNQCLSFEAAFGFNTASSDSVRLFDKTAPPTATNAHIVDLFTYDKIADATKNFQRIPDGSSIWVPGTPSIDFLNLNGAACTPPPSPTATPTPTRTPTPSRPPTPAPNEESFMSPATYENVFITEVIPNPPSGTSEWVELYNNNDFAVSLENWYIDDVLDAGASPYKFILSIPAKSYATVDLPTAMFNNDGDNIRLIDRNENQKDNIAYATVKENYSINRNAITSTTICLATTSKGSVNNPCATDVTPTITTGSKLGTNDEKTSEKRASASATIGAVRGAAKTSPAAPQGISVKRTIPSPTVSKRSIYKSALDSEPSPQIDVAPAARWTLMSSVFFSLLTISSIFFKMNSWHENSFIIGSPL